MPWFWGKNKKSKEEGDDDDESYDSEEFTDEDDEESMEEEQEEGNDDDDNIDDDKEEEKDGRSVNKNENDSSADNASSDDKRIGDHVLAPQQNGHLSAEQVADSLSKDKSPQEGKESDEYQLKLKEECGPRVLESRVSGNSHHSISTSHENVSIIGSEGLHSGDEGYLDTSESEEDLSTSQEDEEDDDDDENISSSDDDEDNDSLPDKASNDLTPVDNHASIRVETVNEDSTDSDNENEAEEEEDIPTSFWEKQSLLALAAEHDRVDILKGILTDDDQDARTELMDSGIPPLHIAISFGSVNATQSLLRMGADPSIRPSIADVKKQAQDAPQGSKLEIPNMGRFDGVTAWELAFGNAAHEEQKKSKYGGASWSMFNSPSSGTSLSSPSSSGGERVIKPVNMPPSKREGIRHAFTAEALRCIGGDEVERLSQLLTSGMPSSIDIGGKDLYDWAVQLGGLKCEEFLRPIEAAKHGDDISTVLGLEQEATPSTPTKNGNAAVPKMQPPLSAGKVLDRPGDEMTVPLLINRLDELESLASALSSCLDNLAEEVSVCHGLLLLGGGASALAAHVKSLKLLQAQKRTLLSGAQTELEHTEQELSDLVQSTGAIGKEVIAMTPTNVFRQEYSKAESFRTTSADDKDDSKCQQLLAQIAASENKILKLRASITDLSEENAKEMEQVERRGLTGGINLVRTLRDELRDLDYQCSEVKNRTATGRAKIGMIHSRLPKQENKSLPTNPEAVHITSSSFPATNGHSKHVVHDDGIVLERANNDKVGTKDDLCFAEKDAGVDEDYAHIAPGEVSYERNHRQCEQTAGETLQPTGEDAGRYEEYSTLPTKVALDRARPPIPGHVEAKRKDNEHGSASVSNTTTTKDSEKIANGDSTALAIRTPGSRGYFTVDLWQVILRIIGLDQAATRRAARMSQKQKGTSANLMIV